MGFREFILENEMNVKTQETGMTPYQKKEGFYTEGDGEDKRQMYSKTYQKQEFSENSFIVFIKGNSPKSVIDLFKSEHKKQNEQGKKLLSIQFFDKAHMEDDKKFFKSAEYGMFAVYSEEFEAKEIEMSSVEDAVQDILDKMS